jgi:hypothetical protein
MAQTSVLLLGPFEIQHHSTTVTRLRMAKAQALLAAWPSNATGQICVRPARPLAAGIQPVRFSFAFARSGAIRCCRQFKTTKSSVQCDGQTNTRTRDDPATTATIDQSQEQPHGR